MLGAAVERLWRQLPGAAAGDAADLAAGIVETIDTVLRTDRYTPTDHDLTTAMEHYIAANLDDHHLGVAMLQSAFHCSRSALYRLFEKHGGVATYIREQRLVRCFDEFSRPHDPPTRVWTVATRWGFENPSHFHRLFVGMFGLSPSALARRPVFQPAGDIADTGTAAQIDQFRQWAGARFARPHSAQRSGGPLTTAPRR